jgi:hypothetical protein
MAPVLTFPPTIQPSVASTHAMLRALRVIIVPELLMHMRYEPCGHRLG